MCDEGLLSFPQTEAAHGYKEFLAAVKQMDKLPVALCTEKEVWAKYGIASNTISIFRKVKHLQPHDTPEIHEVNTQHHRNMMDE